MGWPMKFLALASPPPRVANVLHGMSATSLGLCKGLVLAQVAVKIVPLANYTINRYAKYINYRWRDFIP